MSHCTSVVICDLFVSYLGNIIIEMQNENASLHLSRPQSTDGDTLSPGCSLVLISVERYLAQVDADLYATVFSARMTLLYILLSWASSLGLYSVIVFLRGGFYLSVSAFSVCEPHYESVQMLILTSCLFYFPTTMVLMYCYGTIYHSQKLKMKNRYDCAQCAAGVGCCVTDSFNVCQSSQHRQSSCAVYRTAALPVLAGLADVEGISHTAPNTSGALCSSVVNC